MKKPDFALPSSLRKIIHVDMDAFYASVEQRDFPFYQKKPVIVGGNPEGRGVVATCSYEARRFGVRSAMPMRQAVQLCPEAVILPPRFEVYQQVSREIRKIFLDITPLVEPLSLDEAYLDVTENSLRQSSATLLAKEIQRRILKTTHLTASAGVSYNKFLAKIASGFEKPSGLTVIPPEKALEFIANLSVGKFFGVGEVTEKKMRSLGILTGKDLKSQSLGFLVSHFGKMGHFYFEMVRGKDERPVKPQSRRQSVGKECTFPKDLDDLQQMKEFLAKTATKVSQILIRYGLAGKTVTLKIRYSDFQSVTRQKTLDNPQNKPYLLAKTALDLLEQTYLKGRKVRLLGITVSHFSEHFEEPLFQI